MQIERVIANFNKLRNYCEKQNFKGYDVSDSIASVFIRRTFLGKIPLFRFAMIQATGHRIAVFNLRPFLFIPKYYNAKGIALFLNGYCNIYDVLSHKKINIGISKEECLNKINYLSNLLISLKSNDYSGAGWGYPTAWQSRSFYFPPNTPTVVVTSFAVDALFHSYEITKKEKYKEIALSSASFILNDLKRTPYKNGFLFSYSPLNGNDTVYNASLLGGKTLALCYKYSHNPEYIKTAKICIQTCIDCQRKDGSWIYGAGKTQKWIDNFHTGYNLDAINEYQNISKDFSFKENIDNGTKFFLDNFFDRKDYSPKYFNNKKYPVDIHCCGELFVILNKLNIFKENRDLANGVLNWTFNNMQHPQKGYFYFQKRKFITNKTPLMRWSESFMFNALSYYFKSII